jgi:hypothetical protein
MPAEPRYGSVRRAAGALRGEDPGDGLSGLLGGEDAGQDKVFGASG